MIIPEKVQKIIDKSKVLYNTETAADYVWWLKPHEEYEMPKLINEIAPNFEIHILRGPHLIRFLKDGVS